MLRCTGQNPFMATPGTSLALRLRFFGSMRKYLPPNEDGPLLRAFSGPVTVGSVLDVLAIEPEDEMAVAINGELGGLDSQLSDGDELTLFGPMEGG